MKHSDIRCDPLLILTVLTSITTFSILASVVQYDIGKDCIDVVIQSVHTFNSASSLSIKHKNLLLDALVRSELSGEAERPEVVMEEGVEILWENVV